MSAPESSDGKVVRIRTSDRASFKNCRRRWNWSSSLREGRAPVEAATPLWLGSACHFALEDYHGYNVYQHPTTALRAFVAATRKTRGYAVPDDWAGAQELGIEMMEFYADRWLHKRDPLITYWHEGAPQVEVTVELDLLPLHGFSRVIYQGTFDRVVEDSDGFLWIVDYKTAARFEDTHFQTDPQVTAYCWLANKVYQRPVLGMIYQQHKKTLPEAPYILQSGQISVNKSQNTNHALYREALLNLYGDVNKAPDANIKLLNDLVMSEGEESDNYVRRDRIFRSQETLDSEEDLIMLEVYDMLDPEIPLYPNKTRSCGYCPFHIPCVSLDGLEDWEAALEDCSTTRREDFESWRNNLPPLEKLARV